ncbi:MAG TPA: serine hydroxymethyltransferase [Candidatus Paceibacterota bacterium]|nr:serine hydroxymethyltransferase [Candidatus Paceibacterota bacterium]
MKDREIARLIAEEEKRQQKVTNLIASENDVSPDVLAALGSVFTNKYAEGYPGRRYYGGNTIVDRLESLCQARALELFGLSAKRWQVNVQPLSGSPANMAVYAALVPIGGTIMGMSLAHGGHLTHGHKVSFTGMAWKQAAYGVDPKTERIDYNEVMRLAIEAKPAIIVAGFTAYPRKIDWKRFRTIAKACGALLMVDMSHIAGLVAGKAYPSPFPYADIVTTTTHKTLRGPRGAMIFAKKDDRGLPEKIDKAVFPGLQGGPHENAIAGIAVALREAATPAFHAYAKRVVANAQVLAHELASRGWRIVSNGTDSHLLLVDTWNAGEGISGAEASERLEAAGIIVNKNTIPGETRSAFDPSGIRIGTACVTTRGAKERDMRALAERIDRALRSSR